MLGQIQNNLEIFNSSRDKIDFFLCPQDWLSKEFAGMNATLSTVDVARAWLTQMGDAARAMGLTVQYCMANPRHAMQS